MNPSKIYNESCESWENMASIRVTDERNYYCTSNKCCNVPYTQQKYNGKTKQVETVYYTKRINKVFRAKSKKPLVCCEKCNEPLMSKRVVQ